jgi:MoxR-like ATPase
MPWEIFTGSGVPRLPENAWETIPEPPPWRQKRADDPPPFVALPKLVEAVNAALHLRRPLLLTGLPGSGKSTLVELIAAELQLGPVLRWHVTSKSTLDDALYTYDALGRLHATQVGRTRPDGSRPPDSDADVAAFVTLGPLGTALASADHPRAVLVDEIDKSDLDLPGDLLDVLERGEFRIPQLVRDTRAGQDSAGNITCHRVFGIDGASYAVTNGVVESTHLPVIVFTSNGERTFPPPFLRRCIRFELPTPGKEMLARIVEAHLSVAAAAGERRAIEAFAARLDAGDSLAVDQLLNLLYLVTGTAAPATETRSHLEEILLAGLDTP